MTSSSRRRARPTRTQTLGVLWATYATFYFCRVNFGPAMPVVARALALTPLEVGLVLSAVKLGYALGQLVNGQLTEAFGAKRILSIGMVGSCVATLLIAFATPMAGARAAAVMMALAFANGWFQAGGWPPLVKIAARWFPFESRGRTMGLLGTSYTLGSAVAIFAVGALLDASGGQWRVAFVVPALVVGASFVHTALRLRENPPERTVPEVDAAPDRLPIADALRLTISNPRIWVLALGLFGLDAVRYGFLDWAPGHLAQAHGTGSFAAALKTAVFPLAGAAGTLSSGWVTDRFFDSRRAPAIAILLGAVGALTLSYRVVVGWGAAPTVACLALVGFCLYGAQILLVGTAAQDFARRGATAAAAGFVDFTGHLGAFAGDVVTGWMIKRHGWAGAIGWWAAAAVVAAMLVATLWNARPQPATAQP